MNKMLLILAISVLGGSLPAQESPTTPKAVRVRIIEDRVGKGAFNDYQLDNDQSRWLPRALRNRALRYRSK